MVHLAQNRILVVEDEGDMRNGLQKMLAGRGYGVDTAEDGLKAVKKMEQTSFQVVIADLKMPGLDGVTVLRRAKEINRATAVIIITGYGTVASAVESMRLGATDYIAKPFHPEDIIKAVEKALMPFQTLEQEKPQKRRAPIPPGQIQERRLLLEYCGSATAHTATHRVVTPENIDRLTGMYPGKRLRLWQWLPSETSNADLATYRSRGGYQALAKVLQGKPAAVISEVKASGLIGRGGAGFPTGLKWEAACRAPGNEKYFVCNAEEGEPGACKDKLLLDQNPHKVVEGMTIGAYAIGAGTGYLYIKDKYRDTAALVEKAIKHAQAEGLLGQHILGSEFSFTLRVLRAPGAYVCGEETALCRSIAGKRPVPQVKPPYPTVCGLFDRPTVINNVETLANIPHIIQHGASWFRQIGVAGSYGTKLFSIAGNVRNAGVFEVELGRYSLSDLIYGLAQGIENDGRLKAVLPGGPSTGFIAADDLDVMVDHKSLERAGTSLGTGAIIVLDENVGIPELVKHFFGFYQKESCGDCVSCRVGTRRVTEILGWMTAPIDAMGFREWHKLGGPAGASCLEMLTRVGKAMKSTAKCGLGQAASEPLLSSIMLFEKEYQRLIAQRQQEYQILLERASVLSREDDISDPVRTIMHRIDLH